MNVPKFPGIPAKMRKDVEGYIGEKRDAEQLKMKHFKDKGNHLHDVSKGLKHHIRQLDMRDKKSYQHVPSSSKVVS